MNDKVKLTKKQIKFLAENLDLEEVYTTKEIKEMVKKSWYLIPSEYDDKEDYPVTILIDKLYFDCLTQQSYDLLMEVK